jgi:uncharacterized membrane protein
MLKKFLIRIRNKKVIAAVVAGILLILVNVGVIDVQFSDKVTDIVNTLLGVGVALGIFSNPDDHIQE